MNDMEDLILECVMHSEDSVNLDEEKARQLRDWLNRYLGELE